MKLVLIADDEAALLEVMSSVVEELGHRVVCASNGTDALALAHAHQPDLVISDHMMPGLSGVELLRIMRRDAALMNTPFILMSAANPRGAEEATAFLSKPISLDLMERVINEGLRHARIHTEDQARTPVPIPPTESGRGIARAELLSWIAHEVKTPLSSARLNLDLLLRNLPPNPEDAQQKRARAALNQLERLSTLVNSVLEATQLADGKVNLNPSPHSLKKFVTEVVSYWRETKPEFDLRLELPQEDATATLDGIRVRQIADNLISNAIKYHGESMRVDVRLEISPSRFVISVRDYGIGIDAAELPRIFDRFHRAEGAHAEGHGLGLYIATALAQLHGGALHATSERGAGSTFSLAVPLNR